MSNANTKVTVSKEVAEAIEDVRGFYSKAEIIAAIVNYRGNSAYGAEMMTLITYARHNGIEKLMSALVNGYEVEKSPEEKLREYHEKVHDRAHEGLYADTGNDFYTATGELDGIIRTLDLLGVKITGINAP